MADANRPMRYIGLDIHKRYLVACGVDQTKEVVYGPRRVPYEQLDDWIVKELNRYDSVALEMTTNTWTMVDLISPRVHSVTVVHPPDVHVIVKARVMTDKKAAVALAELLAADLLPAVWVPPQEVRDLRALVAQRFKLVGTIVQVKNRLHSLLHRHHIVPPSGSSLFAPAMRHWWQSLPLSKLELVRVACDLDTLAFMTGQKAKLERVLGEAALQDERTPYLVQLAGIGPIGAITLLAAIGDIERFPSAKQLVGYAGLGAAVHDSGQRRTTGRITKTGRRDIRRVMVEAAQHAQRTHPHWKRKFAELEPRLGRNKAIVAIARRLLVAVWHVLTKQAMDRFNEPADVARSLFRFVYRAGVRNLPEGETALGYTRHNLDRLGIGAELTHLAWGSRNFKLPPSTLSPSIAEGGGSG